MTTTLFSVRTMLDGAAGFGVAIADSADHAARLMLDGMPKRAEVVEVEAMTCEWFARCGQPAVALQPHPVLGQVPACARCEALANA
jgi:hypothetical protein